FAGSVIVLTHDGGDQFAEKDGRKKLAVLFSIEKAIFAMKHLSRVYTLRSDVVSLPVDLDLVNSIATTDVVHSVRNIVSGKAGGYIA
ncbi:hypothetical protein BGZ82_007753, partial [Podila clonocystis]